MCSLFLLYLLLSSIIAFYSNIYIYREREIERDRQTDREREREKDREREIGTNFT